MKKYSLIRHIPNFIDNVDNNKYDFDTLNELFNIGLVKNWSSYTDIGTFSRYSISFSEFQTHGTNFTLMVEYNEGKAWYAVGYILCNNKKFDLELPIWNPVYTEERVSLKDRFKLKPAYPKDESFRKQTGKDKSSKNLRSMWK